MPTEEEWVAERDSWTSDDAAGAFASPLKLPLAGRRHYSNGVLDQVGCGGNYWPSTIPISTPGFLSFHNTGAGIPRSSQALGFSVRCIKD